jgi:3-oxoadipate enol-lactonase
MPTVRVRGIDVYYEEHGSAGPHLLMAHGLLGSVALMRRFAERPEDIAARGVRVVAYDARGHGRSGYSVRGEDYHWQALAEDMRGVIEALRLDRPAVYGGSMGAGTALMLALAHPESVDRLILMSPPPLAERLPEVRRMFGALATLYQVLGVSLTARLVGLHPAMRRLRSANPRLDLAAILADQRRAAIVPAIRGLLDGPPIPAERLGEVAAPALILTHPGDRVHPLASGEILQRRLAQAELVVAPAATYWEEHPDEVAALVAAFVRGEAVRPGRAEDSGHDRWSPAGEGGRGREGG